MSDQPEGAQIENLILNGISSNVWRVINYKGSPEYVEVEDSADDMNNFIEIRHIPQLIEWLQKVYDKSNE